MHAQLAMYQDHFRLTAPPFSIAPDPRFLYLSEKHREALAHLTFGIKNGGFVLLTGEVGTGKTTLCRCLLEQVPDTCDIAFIYNPKLNVIELLQTICDEFGIRYLKGRHRIKYLIDLINKNLLSAHAKGRNSILIIDEAQNLGSDVLEQLRLLTNLETNERKLLQIVMIGQPELQDLLQEPHLRQFAQRITARYHLRPLSRGEVTEYVRHRLRVAGEGTADFSEAAFSRLYRLTGGVPRLINVICDRALLGAYARDDRRVTPAMISQAAREVFGRPVGRPATTSRVKAAVLMSLMLLLGAAGAIAVVRPPSLEGLDRLALDFLPADVMATFRGALGTPIGVDEAATGEASARSGREPETETLRPDPQRTVPPVGAQLVPDPTTIEPAENSLADGQLAGPSVISGDETDAPPLDDRSAPEQAIAAAEGRSAGLSLSAMSVPPAPLDAAPGIRIESTGDAFPTWVQAYDALLAGWNIPHSADEGPPCETAEIYDLGCFKDRGDLDQLRRLDRPAVLRLVDRQGAQFYVALTSLGADGATIVSGGDERAISIEELEALWTGDFSMIWRMPAGYERPIMKGEKGPLVEWVHERLRSFYHGAIGPIRQARYDDALAEQVIRYQAAKGIAERGVIGPRTLMALDADADHEGPTLTRSSPAN